MNLVADEGLDRRIVERLRRDGHSVVYVAEIDPGISDEEVLALSKKQSAVLITADRDFGELVFRQSLISYRVLLMADGLARWTLYPFSCNPSTSQYQLYVDSTTTPLRERLKGLNAVKTSGNRLP